MISGSERENTIAIIGGLGKMGVVERRLHEEAGYSVIISDIRDTSTVSPREAIRRAGIVFFSVWPIENIGEVIQATIDEFDENYIVLDNASLKTPLKRGYEILDAKGVHICSTHPLCKDNQPVFGQNELIAPFGRSPEPATQVAEFVHQKAGMVIVPVDFDRHDALLVANQGYPHLLNRVAGMVLALNGIRPEDISRISTANSRLHGLGMWRTLVQEPKISAGLIADMLRQPEGRKLVKDLQNSIRMITRRQRSKQAHLEAIFADTVKQLDPTGETRAKMDEASVIILEHLANLAKRSFTIETHEKDRPGLLLDALAIVAAHQMNLDTHLSEKIRDGFRFHLGIESGELTPDAIKELEDSGFHVVNIIEPQF